MKGMLESMIYIPWVYRGWEPFPHHPNVMRRWGEVIRVHHISHMDEVNQRLQDIITLSHSGAPLLEPLIPHALVSEDSKSIATLWPYCPRNDSVDGVMGAVDMLHKVGNSDLPGIDLPDVDVMGAMRERMDTMDVSDEVHAVLSTMVGEAEELAHDVSGGCIVHSDAHVGNSVIQDGVVKLIDCDNLCIGPPEWDFLPMLHSQVRFGKEITCIDGVDWGRVESWLPIRDASTCTWLATQGGQEAKDELHNRLFQDDYVWSPF